MLILSISGIHKSRAEVTALLNFVGFCRTYGSLLRRVERAGSSATISFAEGRALSELAIESGQGAARLARALGMDTGQLSRLLSRLEKKDLIERSDEPSHRRRRKISLTEAGAIAAADIQARQCAAAEFELKAMGAKGRESLLRDCLALAESASEAPVRHQVMIRSFRPEDASAIVDMATATFKNQPPNLRSGIEAEVCALLADNLRAATGRTRGVVAVHDADLLGAMLISMDVTLVAQIDLLFVTGEFQRQGIGRSLIEDGTSWAKDKGCVRLHASALGRGPARTFYSNLGWKVKQTNRTRVCGRTLDCETWELKLR